jgi:hypothetical protein
MTRAKKLHHARVVRNAKCMSSWLVDSVTCSLQHLQDKGLALIHNLGKTVASNYEVHKLRRWWWLWKLLTPCSGDFEKLAVSQAVYECSALLKPKFSCCVHKIPPLTFFWLHVPCVFVIHFNIIRPSIHRSPKRPLRFFLLNILCIFYVSRAHCLPSPPHPPGVSRPANIWLSPSLLAPCYFFSPRYECFN